MARPRPSDDDSAPLFFLLALLASAVLPWTFFVLWELLFPGRREVDKAFPTTTEDGLVVRHCQTQAMASKRAARMEELRSRRRICTRGFLIRTAILLLLWCWLAYIVVQVRSVLATSALYQNFDPHSILGVSGRSGAAEVKKAFRKMSLKYHPDKNTDPSAPERFMLIKKAYDALTDPIAKRNYELYGNPDGPSTMELSVAIPSFSKEHQGLILVLFVLLFVIGVPLTLLWCMSGSGPELCGNGVRRTTMEELAGRAKELTDVRKAQEFLLGSDESASCQTRPGEEQALAELAKELQGAAPASKASSKKGSSGPAAPNKAEVLFLAHTQRRRDLLGDALSADLEELLGQWRRVSLAMADIAAKLGLGEPLEAALELHRCVVQGLESRDAGASSAGALLQVPSFTVDRMKLWRKGPRKSAGLPELLALDGEELRSGLDALSLSPQELADIEEFAVAAPRVELLEAKVFVEGEEGICQGDYATLQVKFRRNNLHEREAAGAAHAPLFPGAEVHEAWWVRLTMPSSRGKTSRCRRILNPGREVAWEMKFKVLSVGKCRCTVSLMCEAYAGLDVEQSLSFEAKRAPAEQAADASGSDEEGSDGEED